MTNEKYWYAEMRDAEDDDWGTGTFDRSEAEEWLKACKNEDAYIAVIDGGYDENGNQTADTLCIDEIRKEDI